MVRACAHTRLHSGNRCFHHRVKGKEKKKKIVIKEEDEAAREEDDVVIIVIIDKDDKMVEVILIPESTPLRSPYKQTARIQIGP
jgi:hypothetical protein